MKIQSISSNDRLPQASNLSMNGQGDEKEADKVQVLFGKAATWQMSNMAKRLKEVAEWERSRGPYKTMIDTEQALAKVRLEKKEAANKLEKQLSDFTLSEQDKKSMREEIDKLREEAKSPQDKEVEALNEFKRNLSTAQKQQKDAPMEEKILFTDQINGYKSEIQKLESKFFNDAMRQAKNYELMLQEEADHITEKMEEETRQQDKEEEVAGPSFGTVMEEQQLLLMKKKEEEEKEKKLVNEAMGKPEEEIEKTEEGTKENADAEKESEGGNHNKSGTGQ